MTVDIITKKSVMLVDGKNIQMNYFGSDIPYIKLGWTL